MHSRSEIIELIRKAITEEVIIIPTITTNYLLSLQPKYQLEIDQVTFLFGYLLYKSILIMEEKEDKYLLPWDISLAVRLHDEFEDLLLHERKIEIEVNYQYFYVSLDFFVAFAYWLSFFEKKVKVRGTEFDITSYLNSTHCRYLNSLGKSYCFEYENPKAELVVFYSSTWDYYEGLSKAVELSKAKFPILNKNKLEIKYGQ